MADLSKIFTGMDKGPESIDDNFNKVLQMLTDKDQKIGNLIKLSDYTDAGIVFHADFEEVPKDDDVLTNTGYIYAQFPGFKIVSLNLCFQLPKAFNQYTKGFFVEVPESISWNRELLNGTTNGGRFIIGPRNNNTLLISTFEEQNFSWVSGPYYFTATYIHVD